MNSMLGFTAVAMIGKRMGLPPRMLRVMADSSCIGLHAMASCFVTEIKRCGKMHEVPAHPESRPTVQLSCLICLMRSFLTKIYRESIVLTESFARLHMLHMLHSMPIPQLCPSPTCPAARAHRFQLVPPETLGHAWVRCQHHQGHCPRGTLPHSFHRWRWGWSDLLVTQRPKRPGPTCTARALWWKISWLEAKIRTEVQWNLFILYWFIIIFPIKSPCGCYLYPFFTGVVKCPIEASHNDFEYHIYQPSKCDDRNLPNRTCTNSWLIENVGLTWPSQEPKLEVPTITYIRPM